MRQGTPRFVPLGFCWNGTEFVICTLPHSPKVKALASNPHVALTIDTVEFPPHVLLVRGTAALELVPGVPPEYLEAARQAGRSRRHARIRSPGARGCTRR